MLFDYTWQQPMTTKNTKQNGTRQEQTDMFILNFPSLNSIEKEMT